MQHDSVDNRVYGIKKNKRSNQHLKKRVCPLFIHKMTYFIDYVSSNGGESLAHYV